MEKRRIPLRDSAHPIESTVKIAATSLDEGVCVPKPWLYIRPKFVLGSTMQR